MAIGAFASYVAISQELLSLLIVELLSSLLCQFALVVQVLELLSGELMMRLTGRAAVDID